MIKRARRAKRANKTFSYQRRLVIPLVLLLLVATLLPMAQAPQTAHALPWRDKGTPFGVVAALGNRVREDETGAAVALMREAGVQWQREEIFWHEVQHAPGGPFIWNGNGAGFYNYDHAIEMQVSSGINVLGLLDYNPAWFKGKNPRPDEWLNDWGIFVYETVARYGRDRGWIKHWELWNEPNLAASGYESGLYTPLDFVRLLEVGQAAAKAADPEAVIVMGGLASVWGQQESPYNYDYFEYLQEVADYGGWDNVDVLAIHLYRPGPPEGHLSGKAVAMNLRTELHHLDELMAQYGSKPVWITEIGWPTHQQWPGVDADTQAFYLIRMYILALAHPSVEKIFWYDFRNDSDPNAPYHWPVYNDLYDQFHYGLLRRSYPLDPNRHDLRKPSFVAYRTMTNLLGGLSLLETRTDGDADWLPNVYWYRFGNDTRRVDVLWHIGEGAPEINLECDCREALVRSWNGELKELVYSDEGSLKLRLDNPGSPIYVEYDPPVPQDGLEFGATGHRLRGAFLNYWQTYGGMARFGNPLTDELLEPEAGTGRPRIVQYFERARFEHHPERSNSVYEVSLGNPGQAALERRGINWHDLPKVTEVITGNLLFEQTGHSIAPPFLPVWEQYGGVPLMGYPLTEPFSDTLETGEQYTVQYFERARLEHYPERAGTPGEMQFGSLTRERITSWWQMKW